MHALRPISFLLLIIVIASTFIPNRLQAAEHSKLIEKPPVIAVITWRGETDAEIGFKEGLYKKLKTVSIRMYHANQNQERLQTIIDQLQNAKLDLIYTFGTTVTQNVLARIKSTPIVFNIVNRPVESGIIDNWKHSGNNATGASNQVPVYDQLRALKKIVKYNSLGIIYNPRERNSMIQKDIAQSLTAKLDFELEEFHITGPADIPRVLSGLKGRVDAVFIPADSMTKSLGKQIMTGINDLRIPSLCTIENMVLQDGGLLGLAPSHYQLGRLAADKALLVLEGQEPTHIPVSMLDHFYLSINMKTAQKIGVQIPMSLLIMADKIVR